MSERSKTFSINWVLMKRKYCATFTKKEILREILNCKQRSVTADLTFFACFEVSLVWQFIMNRPHAKK